MYNVLQTSQEWWNPGGGAKREWNMRSSGGKSFHQFLLNQYLGGILTFNNFFEANILVVYKLSPIFLKPISELHTTILTISCKWTSKCNQISNNFFLTIMVLPVFSSICATSFLIVSKLRITVTFFFSKKRHNQKQSEQMTKRTIRIFLWSSIQLHSLGVFMSFFLKVLTRLHVIIIRWGFHP